MTGGERLREGDDRRLTTETDPRSRRDSRSGEDIRDLVLRESDLLLRREREGPEPDESEETEVGDGDRLGRADIRADMR